MTASRKTPRSSKRPSGRVTPKGTRPAGSNPDREAATPDRRHAGPPQADRFQPRQPTAVQGTQRTQRRGNR